MSLLKFMGWIMMTQLLPAICAGRGSFELGVIEMARTAHRAGEARIFGVTTIACSLICAWAASSSAQTVSVQHPAKAKGYVYWTNYNDGSIGRATIKGKKVNEKFTTLNTANEGAGITVDSSYIYWSLANGGTGTYIARANLDGSGANGAFINTGGDNPCGVAVDSSYIYWAGDVGSYIGRANLDGSGVNQDFIETGTRVCGIAVTSKYIYWSNYVNGEIGRANLDGSGANNDFINASAGEIAIVGNYIYFSTAGGTAIGRVKTDGSDLNTGFITGLTGNVAFLAADKEYIFWAASSADTIGRANIDGSNSNPNFVKGTNGGFGIAVTGGDP